MATIQLKNIPDDLLQRIHQLAEQHQRTLDEQIIQLLQQAAPLQAQPMSEPDQEVFQRIEAGRWRREQRPTPPPHLDSTLLLREDRDR